MSSRNGRILLEIVTVQDLASMFSISERQVQRLTVQGVLKLARNSKRQTIKARYRLGEAVSAYVRHMQERNGTDPCEALYTTARARRMEALAQKEELNLRLFKGDLHRADDIMFVLTNMLSYMRSQVMALPSKVTRLVLAQTDFATVYRVLEEHVRLCLNELSEANYAEAMAAQRKLYLVQKGVLPEGFYETERRDGD
jgi:phage terminase Nu1 subunit (DNA packaging protein)